jgi:hypothetical protein
MKFSDDTIPRKLQPRGNAAQRAEPPGLTWGWFVDYGGDIGFKLRSAGGKTWPQDQVRMLSGAFGHDQEGVQKAPRPRVYADDGATVLVEGDAFAIDFLNGNPDLPILLGAARTLTPADTEFWHSQPMGEDPDAIRMRAAQINPKTGEITGTLQVRALDGKTAFEIVVGGGAFGEGYRFEIDYTAGTIKAGKGNEAQPVPLGKEMLDAFTAIITDIAALAAISVPVIPPAGLQTTALLVKVNASAIGAGGLPLLSPIVRIE